MSFNMNMTSMATQNNMDDDHDATKNDSNIIATCYGGWFYTSLYV